MATTSYSFTGSTVPLGVANAVSFAELVANIQIEYHRAYEDWVQKHSRMKMFYQLRYEGPNMGTDFYCSESIVGSGVAHETDENAEPYIGDFSNGYSKSVTVHERTFSLAITRFVLHHTKYPAQLMNAVRGAAEACAKRMEYDMAMPFTYCTSTAVTNIDARSVDVSSGDGLSFANASHTLVNSSITYRNRIASDPQISQGALELAENLFHQQMYDNNGQSIEVTPDTIVVNSDATTLNVALTITRSKAAVDAANSNVWNAYEGKYRVVQASSIDRTFSVGGKGFTFDSTKQKQWMLVDSTNSGLYLFVTEYPMLEAPTESNGGIQYLTKQRTWIARTTYEQAAVDPRFAVISVVTTA